MVSTYDCVVIGGGIAGLQAAIQLGRYQHQALVIDSKLGRSTLCRNYHNILGWPNGVSGETLRNLGREHARSYGIQFLTDTVIAIKDHQEILEISCESGEQYYAKKVLLATGVLDRLPSDIEDLIPCLGLSVYVCPDCDGYEIRGKKTVVLGAGKVGAQLALTLMQWTNSLTYINHDGNELEAELQTQLVGKGITYIKEPIKRIISKNSNELKSIILESGQVIEAEKGFIGFGGNKVRTDLIKELSVERMENNHVIVDPRTKRTSHPNIWAAGDIAVHSEQVTIAMGDGMQAAIWIHKSLVNEQ
ncbi:NAD(P)/FAD-dependent oxidoreductase [Bacillus sp. PS06]|uniref:NAD(P)/FAD-dependent oxidoreductase n=1 Tax=Bacillus sp. PS06 TaxID=2764176 RepID=UPI0017846A5C|nr:NAD(P)/FAD-dependent oxidoreductase [Bacillus sp. PS06]MBD8068051.1 NAD(P)/FAD-dependent oxidoreductase [Bacillus sp. PS06]